MDNCIWEVRKVLERHHNFADIEIRLFKIKEQADAYYDKLIKKEIESGFVKQFDTEDNKMFKRFKIKECDLLDARFWRANYLDTDRLTITVVPQYIWDGVLNNKEDELWKQSDQLRLDIEFGAITS